MKILLIGEYSRLHNSLKEGLQELGNEVFLVAMQDSFKKYPADFNYDARTLEFSFFKFLNKFFRRIFKADLDVLERGIRFFFILHKLKNYDVVQFINETPIQTFAWIEKLILKRLIKQNKKVFLLSCGSDYVSVNFAKQGKFRYSIFDIFSEDKTLEKHFKHSLRYLKPEMQKISEFLYKNINGVIASDIDYVLPLQENPKFLGLIPNPININNLNTKKIDIKNKIIIFLGINRNSYFKKGIPYFEKVLKIIKKKYQNKIAVFITENLPYYRYINIYNNCHILLDQIYAYDQGYNALEAMAKGKVVFTGAEREFLKHYNLKEDQVAINTLPNVDYLVEKLSYLIENTQKIYEISENAKYFIKQKHDHILVAKKYLETWHEN